MSEPNPVSPFYIGKEEFIDELKCLTVFATRLRSLKGNTFSKKKFWSVKEKAPQIYIPRDLTVVKLTSISLQISLPFLFLRKKIGICCFYYLKSYMSEILSERRS